MRWRGSSSTPRSCGPQHGKAYTRPRAAASGDFSIPYLRGSGNALPARIDGYDLHQRETHDVRPAWPPAGRIRATPAPPPGPRCVISRSMGGEAGAARQLAGLLRGGGRDRVAQRVARVVAEACAGLEPAEAPRVCSALREGRLE